MTWCNIGGSAFLLMLTVGAARAESPEPYGIEERIPWTTSRVIGSPDPPSPYVVEVVFPNLEFRHVTLITHIPGTDRLVVAERHGLVSSFPDDPSVSRADLLVDIGGSFDRRKSRVLRRGILGLAFHPDFEKNRYFYLFVREKVPGPPRNRIARFEMRADSWQADPHSEHIILEFPSDGHNGGCLKFGPDGYLYIAAGDSGGLDDPHRTGQFIDDLLASILRIDVNGTHSAKSYAIPPDNPFVNFPGAAPEVYAYGLRQPWKMSFDRKTGELWVGDVGQDLWEMVYKVRAGGNYGWSIMEGPQEFRPRRQRGPTPILPPLMSHGHGESRSLTGGFVYRGSRLRDLYGAYIYADYETGKIWGLRANGDKVVWSEELAVTSLDFPAFGEDRAGELYFVSHETGRVCRLVRRPSTPSETRASFPRRLSETGLFASVSDHRPAPGLIPYSVNAPLWSDGASKERFIALPPDAKITYRVDDSWVFPEGTVFVKTFSLGSRRLETRLLTLQGGQWAGYTYLWNDEQTDGVLLGRDALEKTYTVRDSTAPGGEREKTWYYPSRADCMVCHNNKASFVLGLSTVQMNKDHDYAGVVDNQLRTLTHLELFSEPPPSPPEGLPRLVDPQFKSAPLEKRARSYLHANCSHCHQSKGGGNSDLVLLYRTPLEDTRALGAKPLHGALGITNPQILAPGEPKRSLLHRRMATRGEGQMPHISSHEVDRSAVELVREWILSLGQ